MSDCSLCAYTWKLVGVACVFLLLSFLWNVVIPAFLIGNVEVLKKKYNKTGKAWAVVTGTTSGIGAAFVAHLVKLGFNVLMIARNEAKLKETKQLFASSPVKIEYIVIDLGSRKGPLVSVELSKFLEANEVSILINNAGVNTEYPKMFVDNSVSESEAILDVNCRATALMTHAVLPFMLKRNNGLVVNISSLLGQLSGPLVAMYSASKSFVDSFSLSLSEELRGTGVSVFCSTPGFVVSNMSKIKRPSLTVLTPETCARSILQQIAGGWLRIASPSWTHASISWLFRVIVPEFARLRNMGNINRRTNKAALRKK